MSQFLYEGAASQSLAGVHTGADHGHDRNSLEACLLEKRDGPLVDVGRDTASVGDLWEMQNLTQDFAFKRFADVRVDGVADAEDAAKIEDVDGVADIEALGDVSGVT